MGWWQNLKDRWQAFKDKITFKETIKQLQMGAILTGGLTLAALIITSINTAILVKQMKNLDERKEVNISSRGYFYEE